MEVGDCWDDFRVLSESYLGWMIYGYNLCEASNNMIFFAFSTMGAVMQCPIEGREVSLRC